MQPKDGAILEKESSVCLFHVGTRHPYYTLAASTLTANSPPNRAVPTVAAAAAAAAAAAGAGPCGAAPYMQMPMVSTRTHFETKFRASSWCGQPLPGIGLARSQTIAQ